ncbi:hypothetical protein [Lichenicoccus sp.]|uniref:hypothetical protein n=1 Tax=Lichenicoccus sp. TaxID=2781899 RepID=UPI003D115A05
MKIVALMLGLGLLAACTPNTPPRQISNDRLHNGNPPLTGTLPNGVIGDNVTH